jgi:ankyrin repeat protein
MELHREVEKGKIKEVIKLIEEGADVNAKDDRDWRPLDHAAYKGHDKIAELLISQGANVNAHETERGTALHKAAEAPFTSKRHTAIVELLINKGADANAKIIKEDENEYESEDGEVITMSPEYGYTRPLHRVMESGNIQIAELLISNGADVNLKDENGHTALHIAAEGQDVKMIELLVSKGADINAKNGNDGWTPLHLAIEYNKPKSVKILKKLGGQE